jgi:hypothetical protein
MRISGSTSEISMDSLTYGFSVAKKQCSGSKKYTKNLGEGAFIHF